jgi:hypothetical protein
MGLSYRVFGAIVMRRQSGNDDDTPICFLP